MTRIRGIESKRSVHKFCIASKSFMFLSNCIIIVVLCRTSITSSALREEFLIHSYDMKKLGEKLKSYRLATGLTQMEVTELTSISRDTLRRIENGHVVPRYDTIIILSKIYRFDLMKLFNHYTIDEPLMRYYELVDECIATNDVHLIEKLYSELKDVYINGGQKYQLVFVHEIEQMLKLLESIILIYKDEMINNSSEELKSIQQLVIDGIKIRHHKYNLKEYMNYKYSFIELRLLLVYTMANDEDLELQTDLLLFLMSKFDIGTKDPKEIMLIIKLYYNISYNYYRLKEDQLSLKFANTGLKYCNKNNSTFLRAHLLARKGLAMYYLKMTDYMTPLKFSLTLLKIEGKDDLYHSFYNTFVNSHKLNFDKDDQLL